MSTARTAPAVPAAELARVLVAATAGCLVVATGTSMIAARSYPPVLGLVQVNDSRSWWPWVTATALLAVATLGSLALARHWPWLILCGAVLAAPVLFQQFFPVSGGVLWFYLGLVAAVASPMALIGVLAASQWLAGNQRPGYAAAVAGATVGAQLFGIALVGARWLRSPTSGPAWQLGLTVVAVVAVLPAVLVRSTAPTGPHGDNPGRRWQRSMPAAVLAVATLAVSVLVTDPLLSRVLGVSMFAMERHGYATVSVVGGLVLLGALAAVAVAGPWNAAGSLTVALIQIVVAAPILLAAWALAYETPLRLIAAAVGLLLGVLVAASRWRIPLAAGASVLCALALLMAFAATTGAPEKLITQRAVIPGFLLLVGLCIAATALVGSAVSIVARRTNLPLALGPLAAALVYGGSRALQAELHRCRRTTGVQLPEPGSPPDHLRDGTAARGRRRRRTVRRGSAGHPTGRAP